MEDLYGKISRFYQNALKISKSLSFFVKLTKMGNPSLGGGGEHFLRQNVSNRMLGILAQNRFSFSQTDLHFRGGDIAPPPL